MYVAWGRQLSRVVATMYTVNICGYYDGICSMTVAPLSQTQHSLAELGFPPATVTTALVQLGLKPNDLPQVRPPTGRRHPSLPAPSPPLLFVCHRLHSSEPPAKTGSQFIRGGSGSAAACNKEISKPRSCNSVQTLKNEEDLK